MKTSMCVGVLVLTAGCLVKPAHAASKAGARAAKASRVKLDAALGHPMWMAGESGRAFLKVGLAGARSEHTEHERTPANLSIVLDKSSSMSGQKMAEARRAAMMAVERLAPDDVVSVITYDSVVDVLVPATRVTEKRAILARIEGLRASGSTALFAGVSKGAAELRKFIDPGRVNRVILLSDGQANIGPSSPGELATLGRSLAREGISVTTLGLGLGYNEDLMSQLAMASDGNHAFVENAEHLARIFEAEFKDVMSVVAQNVRVEIELAPGVRPLRVLGREAIIDGQTIRARLNQLYAEQEKFFVLEVELPAQPAGRELPIAELDVQYTDTLVDSAARARGRVVARTVADRHQVEEQRNDEVLASATELLAIERTEVAVALRDEGKVDEARQVLRDNRAFLKKQQKKVRGAPQKKRLERLEQLNEESEENMEPSKWNSTRKQMRDYQFEIQNQQSY